MPDIPRFAWPMSLTPAGQFATVKQDSDEDIVQCLRAIVRTKPGERPDVPDMGVADLTFEETPVDLDGVRETVARHEPRVSALLRSSPDAIESELTELDIEWAREPPIDEET